MNMKSVLKLIILIIMPTMALSQPTIQWQNSYGGTFIDGFSTGNNQQDQISTTSDGGYVIAGLSHSNDGDVTGHHGLTATSDCWVLKLDSVGSLEWENSLGGTNDEIGYSIRQTTDGGYILASSTYSDDGDVTGYHPPITGMGGDMWVVKLDASGNITWQRALGGSAFDLGYSILQSYDGNYVVAGRTLSTDGDVSFNNGSSDIWIVKLDAAGNILWEKAIGGSSVDYAYTIRETNDHGFILAGNVNSSDGDFSGVTLPPFGGAFIMKTDSLANIEWYQVVGGSLFEWGFDVTQTSDGGYMLGVNTASSNVAGTHGGMEYWMTRLDNTGGIVWQNCYGSSGNDFFKAFCQTPDGGYALIGHSNTANGNISNIIGSFDAWVIKIDSAGAILWERSYGGTDVDEGTSIIVTPDGGLLIGVESNSNDVDVSGHHGPLINADIWIAKLAPISTGIQDISANISMIAVSPVPVGNSSELRFYLNNPSAITLSVSDLSGRLLSSSYLGKLPQGDHIIGLNGLFGDNLKSGIYFINLSDENITRSLKVVVAR